MTLFTTMDKLVSATCKAHQKWGLYLSYVPENRYKTVGRNVDFNMERAQASLRHPKLRENMEIIRHLAAGNGWTLLLLDSEEEMIQLYKGVDGDDTRGHIYALTCDPTGQLRNENT